MQNWGVSRYFFPFLPIFHCLALLLNIHFYAKAKLFFFPSFTQPLPPSFLTFPSALTTHIRSCIERSKFPLWYIYMSLRIHSPRSFQIYIPFAQIPSQTGLYGDPESSESKRAIALLNERWCIKPFWLGELAGRQKTKPTTSSAQYTTMPGCSWYSANSMVPSSKASTPRHCQCFKLASTKTKNEN